MDKRKFSRIRFSAAGLLRIGGQETPFTLMDISLKGALVVPAEPVTLKKGETAEIEIRLHNSEESIRARAELVHEEAGQLGFRFSRIDLDCMIQLRNLIEYNTSEETVSRELPFLVED